MLHISGSLWSGMCWWGLKLLAKNRCFSPFLFSFHLFLTSYFIWLSPFPLDDSRFSGIHPHACPLSLVLLPSREISPVFYLSLGKETTYNLSAQIVCYFMYSNFLQLNITGAWNIYIYKCGLFSACILWEDSKWQTHRGSSASHHTG